MPSPISPHILAHNPPRYPDELRYDAAQRLCRLGSASRAEALLLTLALANSA